MALSQEFSGATVVGERIERAWRMPLGVASPLWAVFGAAAGAGVAYWWLTKWTPAVNVEALMGTARAAPRTRIEIVAEPEAAPVQASEPEAAAAQPAEAEAAPEPEPQPESQPASEPADDDLTRMTGVGPKLAAALAARGVTRFAQIANWTADDLAEVDAALALRGRAVRENWVDQARRLAQQG